MSDFIVIDNGSQLLRVGIAGDVDPTVDCECLVTRYQNRQTNEVMHLYGAQHQVCDVYRQKQKPRTPFSDELLNNPPVLESLLDFSFWRLELGDSSNPGIARPIVISEPLGCPWTVRKLLLELLFEVYDAPAVLLGVDAAFASRQSRFRGEGKAYTTVSIGEHAIRIIPVLPDGSCLMEKSLRIPIGSSDMVNFLSQTLSVRYRHLRQNNVDSPLLSSLLISRFGYIALDYVSELEQYRTNPAFAEANCYRILINLAKKSARKELERTRVRTAATADELAAMHKRREDVAAELEHLNSRSGRAELAKERMRMIAMHADDDKTDTKSKPQQYGDDFGQTADEWNVYKEMSVATGKERITQLAHELKQITEWLAARDESFSLLTTNISEILSVLPWFNLSVPTDHQFEYRHYSFVPASRMPVSLSSIHLGAELCQAPEILFQPHLVGKSCMGLADALWYLQRSLPEYPDIIHNLHICGGAASITGLSERLTHELTSRTPTGSVIDIEIPDQPGLAAFRGMSSLDEQFVMEHALTQDEYVAAGPFALIGKECDISNHFYTPYEQLKQQKS